MTSESTRAGIRLYRASRMIHALLLLAVSTVMVSCSGQGPKMSGFALGDTRIVSVGDIVTLRTPLGEDGRRQWRVSSYDSFYLVLVERPQVETGSSGDLELVTRVRARNPGVTHVEIVEIAPPADKAPRSVSFKVRITK